jgi:sugar lactone lactonase YvrE
MQHRGDNPVCMQLPDPDSCRERSMDIEVVLDAGATIGESPTWVSAEKALYWIDVKPALYRYDPAAGRAAAGDLSA